MNAPALLLAASLLGLVACGDDSDSAASNAVAASADRAESPRQEKSAVDPARTGAIVGRVLPPPGEAPEPQPAPRMPAGCEGPEPHPSRWLSEGGGLGNVFVTVEDGWQSFAWPAPPEEPVRVVQRGCAFRPRLVAARAGQPVRVSNEDACPHNIHTHARKTRSLNVTQPSGGREVELIFDGREVAPVVCDLHPWMRTFIAVEEHPLFAATAPDGSFRIEGVPEGNVTIALWHEVLGRQRIDVVVRAGEAVDLEHEWAAE